MIMFPSRGVSAPHRRTCLGYTHMSKKTGALSVPENVARLVEAGLDAKKCRRCGKMAGVIDSAAGALAASEDPDVRGMAARMGELRGRMLKQASNDFGCGGCWGSKARKELSKSFKAAKAKKAKKAPAETDNSQAQGPRPKRLRRRGVFTIEVGDGVIRCRHYSRRGEVAHTATGPDGATIVAAVSAARLIKRGEAAAYLGWELARAEAALASGQPYEAQPWERQLGN